MDISKTKHYKNLVFATRHDNWKVSPLSEAGKDVYWGSRYWNYQAIMTFPNNYRVSVLWFLHRPDPKVYSFQDADPYRGRYEIGFLSTHHSNMIDYDQYSQVVEHITAQEVEGFLCEIAEQPTRTIEQEVAEGYICSVHKTELEHSSNSQVMERVCRICEPGLFESETK